MIVLLEYVSNTVVVNVLLEYVRYFVYTCCNFQYDLSLSLDNFYAIVSDVRKTFKGCMTISHGHIGDGVYTYL